jgi:hypothetical protein
MTNDQVLGLQLEKTRKKLPILYDRPGKSFYSTIEKGEVERISSRDMRVPLKLHPGGRFGHWNPAGGDLGRGEGPSYDKAVINTVHMKYACEWQAQAEWATNDERKAVANALKDLLADAMVEFRRASDCLCQTNGTGVIGTVSAVSTASSKDTLTLDSDGYGAKLARYGQMVSVYDAALTTRRTNTGAATLNGEAPIDLVDLSNKQIRLNGTTGATVATDLVVVSGLTATPPVSLYGIPYHVSNASSGTWLGLDRAATPEVRANRVNAGGASFSLPFGRRAVNAIGDRLGEEQMASVTIWTHPCQAQAYEEFAQAVSIIQKQARAENIDMYFGSGMQIAGQPLKTSFMWNRKRMDFLPKGAFFRAEMKPVDYYTVDGRKLFEARGPSGGVAASTMFYIVASWNLCCPNPGATSYVDSLAVPTGY